MGDLNYTDDICLINSSVAEVHGKAKAMSKHASILGLIINKKKTEVIINVTGRTQITLGGTNLKGVHKFTYLGNTVTMNEECRRYIRYRRSRAASVMP